MVSVQAVSTAEPNADPWACQNLGPSSRQQTQPVFVGSGAIGKASEAIGSSPLPPPRGPVCRPEFGRCYARRSSLVKGPEARQGPGGPRLVARAGPE